MIEDPEMAVKQILIKYFKIKMCAVRLASKLDK